MESLFRLATKRTLAVKQEPQPAPFLGVCRISLRPWAERGDRIDLRLVSGCSPALGHPVGVTGTRLVLTLLRALRERRMQRGIATLCVGGGQGIAMLIETDLRSTEH